MPPPTHLATHLLLELYEVDAGLLDRVEPLKEALLEAAHAALCTIHGVVSHHFEPQGVSVVVLVGESHLSIHTWPEHGYAAVDIFTCGRALPERGVEPILRALKPGRHELSDISRGAISELGPKPR